MNKEQKIEWLKTADNEKVIETMQLAVSIVASESTSLDMKIQAKENLELVKAELLRRMA